MNKNNKKKISCSIKPIPRPKRPIKKVSDLHIDPDKYVNSINTLNNKKNINLLLNEYNIYPISTIFIESDKNIIYLKALDPHGYTFYIKVDVDGYIVSSPDDLIFVNTSHLPIDRSNKIGSYNIIDMDVYGIIYECNNALCIINRNDISLEPEETNVILKNSSMDLFLDKIINYPIVKLSEIIEMPSEVIQAIKDVSIKLRNSQYNLCLSDINDLKNSSLLSYNKTTKLTNLFFEKILKIKESLDVLNGLYEDYNKCNITDLEKEKIKKISYNMKYRHDLITDLISFSHFFNNYKNILNSLENDMSEKINYINSKYINLMDDYY